MKGAKILILSSMVFTIILVTGLLIRYYLEKTTSRLLTDIKKAEDFIKNDNWIEAQNAIVRLNKDWDNLKSKWAIFINHHEIDDITVYFKTSEEFIMCRDKAEALASLASLSHYISHIPIMEKLSLENIL
ncbi:DUF4363 family protein [Fonticella tunisiensis]|uniref:Uncharacterized protein DUF4363 n=1 Tax=Fonticella tunisiensis TaxID=1096341 RepID=A0A4R7KP54_9CLOT|nr:DUF4363 family protein [Fonticella tunisiensis]TDT60899.1 uncharacterized protein DUF4363 [Fonticella tunisiensis]